MGGQCELAGNADLYGVGVRIGVYLQWFSSQIAFFCGLEETTGLMESYLVFSTAIVIALFVLTFDKGLHITEVVIMIYMFFGGLVCAIQDTLEQKVQAQRRLWHNIVILLLWSTMTVYSTWFWIAGKSSSWFLRHHCGTSVFLFARIPPESFNKVSKFFASISILYGCFTFASLCYLLGQLVYDIWRNGWHLNGTRIIRILNRGLLNDIAFRQRDICVEEQDEARNDERLHNSHNSYLKALIVANMILQPTALLYSLIGIELMLTWNGITGINSVRSVGQLIPLVIGLVGLLKVLYEAVMKRLGDGKRHNSNRATQTATDTSELLNLPSVAESHTPQALDGKWQ